MKKMKQAVLFWNITRVLGCHSYFCKVFRWRYAPGMAIGAVSKRGFWSADTCGSSIFFLEEGGGRNLNQFVWSNIKIPGTSKTGDLFLTMLEICAPSNRWSEDHHPNKNHQKPSPPYILVVSGEAKKQQWARFVLKNYEVPSDSNDAALLGRLQVCGGRKLVEKMDPVGLEGLMSWFLSFEQWKKPWLFTVYRGLYYPGIEGL